MVMEMAVNEWREEAGLRWRPLDPFGAEVDHDLARLGDPAAERFQALLRERALILARGQSLTMEQQVALLAPVGPLVLRAFDTGYISNVSGSTSALSFHSDACYTDAPFAAISLHATEVVDGASSTVFVTADTAYDSLPAPLRGLLDAHDADMIWPDHELIAGSVCDVEEPGYQSRVALPAVRINPRTGRRCIGVSEMHTLGFVGLSREDSRRALHAIFAHIRAPENRLEHVWRSGDFVVFDNLSLQHARGPTEQVGPRVLQRVVAGA